MVTANTVIVLGLTCSRLLHHNSTCLSIVLVYWVSVEETSDYIDTLCELLYRLNLLTNEYVVWVLGEELWIVLLVEVCKSSTEWEERYVTTGCRLVTAVHLECKHIHSLWECQLDVNVLRRRCTTPRRVEV